MRVPAVCRLESYPTVHHLVSTVTGVLRDDADANETSLINFYKTAVAPIANAIVGAITADITNTNNTNGESALGDVIADAQRAYTQSSGAQFAFMNPGGLRTDLDFDNSPAGEPAGDITYRELFNVQPFGNTVNVATLTGADIKQVLEQQFQADQLKVNGGRESQLILGTNEGFSYSYDLSRAYGDRVLADTIRLDGVPIDPAATYRVAMNSFLAAGGDSFAAFTNGTDPVTGPVDVDTAVDFFKNHPSISPPPANHSTRVG